MPSPELRASLDVIRRAAELACDASSLRAVAGQVGMTAMGLRAFLRREGKPQERTVRKLNQWYVRHVAGRVPEGEDEARAALIILTGFYPGASRSRAALRFLDVMEQEFRASGMAPPPWRAGLLGELRGRGG